MLSVFLSTLLAFTMSALAPETALGPRALLMPLLLIGVLAGLGSFIPGIGTSTFLKVFDSYLPLIVLIAIAALGIVGLLPHGQRMVPTAKKLTAAIADGSISVLGAATTCAAAGIIVGVVTLTGLGLKFSTIVID